MSFQPMEIRKVSLETIKSISTLLGRSLRTAKLTVPSKDRTMCVHDELKRRKLAITHDENRRGIIAKAIGQMARVCMIVHVLDNAVAMANLELDTDEHNDSPAQLSSIVGKRWALQAIASMNYVLDRKFVMMPQEYKLQDASETAPSTSTTKADVEPSSQTSISYFRQETLTYRYGKYAKKVLLHKGTLGKAISSPLSLHCPTQPTAIQLWLQKASLSLWKIWDFKTLTALQTAKASYFARDA